MNELNLLVAGQLDLISEDGWVIGWAWYPQVPERHVEIEILADDSIIGSTVAYQYREDVATAGCGDGTYGFSFALPYQILSSPRPCTISARDQASGVMLPKPVTFSRPALQDANERLHVLNQDLQLLTASLERLQAKETADNKATAALFQTVADFFSQLADVALTGTSPRGLRTLRNAITEITCDYHPLDFTPSAAPDVSVCFIASAEMPTMYRSLAALHRGFAGASAELLILDANDSCDAPLLPLVAGHARYMRLPSGTGPVAQLNELAQATRGQMLLYLSSQVELLGGWLDQVISSFDDLQADVLALRVIGADGIVEHAGALLEDGVLWVRGGHGMDEDLAVSALVDAAGPHVFAIRRQSWKTLGGFDDQFGTVNAALADFCRCARLAGGRVVYQPSLEAMLLEAPGFMTPEAISEARADAVRLKDKMMTE